MTERTSGAGREPPRDPDDWLEHSGSSVFGPRATPPPTPPSRAARPATGRPAAGAWNPAPWAPPPAPASAPPPVAPPPPTPRLPRRPATAGGWNPAPWAPPPGPRDDVPRQPPPGRPQAGRGPDGGRQRPGARRPPSGADPRRDAPERSSGSGLRSPIGLGAAVGLTGMVAFLAALFVLPWFTAGGDGVTLADMRAAFTVAETDPGDVVPGAGEVTGSTLPDGGIPTPDEITDAAEQEVRDAAGEAAAAAIDSGRSRYLELYTDTLWLAVAGIVAVAAVASTLLAPRSWALSLLLGVRRISGAATVLAALAHGAALGVVFWGDGAPSPALGVWLGVAGLGAVLAGCVIGPRE